MDVSPGHLSTAGLATPPSPEVQRHAWLRQAEHLEAEVRDARGCCEAIGPRCDACHDKAVLAQSLRRLARDS